MTSAAASGKAAAAVNKQGKLWGCWLLIWFVDQTVVCAGKKRERKAESNESHGSHRHYNCAVSVGAFSRDHKTSGRCTGRKSEPIGAAAAARSVIYIRRSIYGHRVSIQTERETSEQGQLSLFAECVCGAWLDRIPGLVPGPLTANVERLIHSSSAGNIISNSDTPLVFICAYYSRLSCTGSIPAQLLTTEMDLFQNCRRRVHKLAQTNRLLWLWNIVPIRQNICLSSLSKCWSQRRRYSHQVTLIVDAVSCCIVCLVTRIVDEAFSFKCRLHWKTLCLHWKTLWTQYSQMKSCPKFEILFRCAEMQGPTRKTKVDLPLG